MSAELSLECRLKARALELGFDRAGIARLAPSEHAAFYRAWLAAGHHGEMEYLARPDAVERRLDPGAGPPPLRSALVVAQNYFPGDDADTGDTGRAGNTGRPGGGGVGDDPSRGIVARYARGRDYHKLIKRKLLELLRWLEAEVGHELLGARASVDTGPVLERELARRAGLGWQARNTMLVDPRAGSYFFLGTLLLELELEPDEPFLEDRCGTCNACVAACPTGALLGRDEGGAPVIDARRCISYLTIELRGPIPRELRPLISNRVFGCDVCQEVCPWNGQKFVRLTREAGYLPGASRAREQTGPGPSPGPGPKRQLPGSGSGAASLGSGSERPDSDPACADLRSAPATSGGLAPASGSAAPPLDSDSGRATSASRVQVRIPGTSGPALIELIGMDEAAWDEFSRGSAIRRARRAGFLRNVAVALGNWGSPEAVPALVRALEDPEPLVRGHAAWALGRIGTEEARKALSARADVEQEAGVRTEIATAVAD